MNKFRLTLRILTIACFMFAFAALAQAQATRTWVSGVGDDANPCSRTAPCKTFAGAISKTFINGEIDVLDPGGFGTLTATKSITIDGTGTFASILASGTNGINVNIGVNANDPNRSVRIRGLSINGAGASGAVGTSTGINGINFISGLALYVEDTTIENFTTAGINIPSSTASNELHMRDVTIRNTNEGVRIVNTGGNATLLGWDHVNISHGTTGLNAGNGTRGQIAHCFFAQNSNNGISSNQTTSTTDFTVTDTTIVGRGATVGSSVGINTTTSTHVRITRVVITDNVNALGLGGVVDTGGNNTIMGNGTNQDPNGTLFTQK